jgi:putative membrane protein
VQREDEKGKEVMNKRVIIIAHVVVVGIFLLVGVIAAQQTQNSNQQNSNQASGQQNRNANRRDRNANSSSTRNMNADQSSNSTSNSNSNANSNASSNSNMSDSMNANTSGGNMTRNAAGQMSAGGTAMPLTSADQKFVMEAAMGGMAEVELGRLAAERGSSDSVKQFGQRMVDDHSRANTELMQLTSARGINVPTSLDAKHQAMMTKMSQLSGAAFDREYAKEMVKDHQKDVSLFQKQAMRGADADVKAFAARTLPTLQEHLRMARELNGHGGGNMNSNTNGNTNRHNANNSNANSGNSNNSNRR